MRLSTVALTVVLACVSGCTSARLRQRTVHQASTLSDLQFQQVLDNLAQFAANPSALAWHVNLREGTTQVTDSASGGALVDFGPPAVTQPQLFVSRTAVAQWGMSPVIDHLELRLLSIAYRRAHGSPEMPDPDLLDDLAHELKNQLPLNADLRNESDLFYEYHSRTSKDSTAFRSHVITTNDDAPCTGGPAPLREHTPLARNVCREVDTVQRDLARIHPGWFQVGRRRDVPKDACYVGRSGDSYVWVRAEGRQALTEFTLTVLKFTSLIKETQTLISPGSVKFSPGDRGG